MTDLHEMKLITLLRFKPVHDIRTANAGRYTNMEAALRATAGPDVQASLAASREHESVVVQRWAAPADRVRELITRAPNPPVVQVRARMSSYWGRDFVPTWLVVMKAAHMLRTRALAGALISWKTTVERLRLSRARIAVETSLATLPDEARLRVLAFLACPYDSLRTLVYMVTYVAMRAQGHIFGPVPALVTQPEEMYDTGLVDWDSRSDLTMPYARSLVQWVARRL